MILSHSAATESVKPMGIDWFRAVEAHRVLGVMTMHTRGGSKSGVGFPDLGFGLMPARLNCVPWGFLPVIPFLSLHWEPGSFPLFLGPAWRSWRSLFDLLVRSPHHLPIAMLSMHLGIPGSGSLKPGTLRV